MAKKTTPVKQGPPDEAYKLERWVYIGERFVAERKKMYYVWHAIQEDGSLGEAHWYEKDPFSGFVGAIYQVWVAKEVDVTWHKSAGDKRPKYEGRWGETGLEVHQEQLLKWKLYSDQARAYERLLKARDKDSKYDAVREQLAPVKEVLARQIGGNRTAMLAVILDYLTR